MDAQLISCNKVLLRYAYYSQEVLGETSAGKEMMQKLQTLQPKVNERLNAFYNRFKGFYAENRIRAQDDIKITKDGKLITPDRDEVGERYRVSSDIVLCLYLAHPDLPAEVEKALSSKLEHQDVASLEREIMVKASKTIPGMIFSCALRMERWVVTSS